MSLVPIARKGEMIEEAFRIANRLMTDEDDMVQKGVGWLLKEAPPAGTPRRSGGTSSGGGGGPPPWC